MSASCRRSGEAAGRWAVSHRGRWAGSEASGEARAGLERRRGWRGRGRGWRGRGRGRGWSRPSRIPAPPSALLAAPRGAHAHPQQLFAAGWASRGLTFGSPGASVAPAAGDRLPVGSARVRPPGGLRSTLQGQGSGKRLWARLGPGRPRDSRTAQTRASSSSGARPENPESRCGSAPDGAGVGLLACPAGPGVTHLPVGNCFPPEQASGPRLGWPGTRGLPRAGPGCGRRRGPARTSAWQRESRLFLGYAGCSHLFSESGGIGMPGS